MILALVDAGTSRTRLRLWDGAVVWEGSRGVGAGDVARSGSPAPLEKAVSELLEEARSVARTGAIVLSGMITSNVGLIEVAHLRAPVSFAALARGVVRHLHPRLGELHLIPGVKTLPEVLTPDTLSEADVMRGEEVEVVGLRELLKLSGPATFAHFGSHSKIVRTDAGGTILGSRTQLTGELLSALASDTVLAGSVTPISQLAEVDFGWWRRGLKAARQKGFGRACFMVRLADVLLGASKDEAASFLLGVCASLDLKALERAEKLVLYGRAMFTEPLARYLKEQGAGLRVADSATSGQAAAVGAARVFGASQVL